MGSGWAPASLRLDTSNSLLGTPATLNQGYPWALNMLYYFKMTLSQNKHVNLSIRENKCTYTHARTFKTNALTCMYAQ